MPIKNSINLLLRKNLINEKQHKRALQIADTEELHELLMYLLNINRSEKYIGNHLVLSQKSDKDIFKIKNRKLCSIIKNDLKQYKNILEIIYSAKDSAVISLCPAFPEWFDNEIIDFSKKQRTSDIKLLSPWVNCLRNKIVNSLNGILINCEFDFLYMDKKGIEPTHKDFFKYFKLDHKSKKYVPTKYCGIRIFMKVDIQWAANYEENI